MYPDFYISSFQKNIDKVYLGKRNRHPLPLPSWPSIQESFLKKS